MMKLILSLVVVFGAILAFSRSSNPCKSGTFFYLPVTSNGNFLQDGSGEAYCKALGFAKRGAKKTLELSEVEDYFANKPIVESLKTKTTCSTSSCKLVAGLQCLKLKNDVACPADAKGNVGVGNKGIGGFGFGNDGNYNIGVNNRGNNNIGRNLQGGFLAGSNLQGNRGGTVLTTNGKPVKKYPLATLEYVEAVKDTPVKTSPPSPKKSSPKKKPTPNGPGPNGPDTPPPPSCSSGEYLKNNVCTACSTCASGEYISTACAGSTNTVCTACGTCPSGKMLKSDSPQCTGTTTTNVLVCEPISPAYSWGSAANGRLGNDQSTGEQLAPVAVISPTNPAGFTKWKVITTSVSGKHACGVSNENNLFCWGLNDVGQAASSDLANNLLKPTYVNTDSIISAWLTVSAGYDHTCGIAVSKSAGEKQLFCWGGNGGSQLGNGDNDYKTYPTAVAVNNVKSVLPNVLQSGDPEIKWQAVSTGTLFTCGIVNYKNTSCDPVTGVMVCVGAQSNGQLGDGNYVTGDPTSSPTWRLVFGSHSWKAVSSGDWNSCGITSDNDVLCWGQNAFVNGLKTETPQALQDINNNSMQLKTINVGYSHACGIGLDDHGYCWGNVAAMGAATPGYKAKRLELPLVGSAAPKWKAISAGSGLSCGTLLSDSRGYCWGSSYAGNGISNTVDLYKAKAVKLDTALASISAGSGFAVATTP